MSRTDDFQGDNAHLVECINALLDMDDAKALVPHGLGKGSHAYRLLNAAAHRIATDLNRANEIIAEKEAEIARLRETLRHSQGRFLNINIALTTNRGKAVNEAIAYADIGEDCIKMALARAALKDKRP